MMFIVILSLSFADLLDLPKTAVPEVAYTLMVSQF